MKQHIVYKTTNTINNHYYIGVHSTSDINDGYLGSGKRFKAAVKKYGKDNFNREILFIYATRKEALLKEGELVNKNVVMDLNSYNLIPGGSSFNINRVSVVDVYGVTSSVFKDDLRYLSGELTSVIKGKVAVYDTNGVTSMVSVTDPQYLNGELIPISKNRVLVRDSSDKCFTVSVTDTRYLSGELKGASKGKVCVYDVSDPHQKGFMVLKDDIRYISGVLVAKSKGRKCSEYNKIQKSLKYSNSVWMHNFVCSRMIQKDEVDNMITLGWQRGRGNFKKKNIA